MDQHYEAEVEAIRLRAEVAAAEADRLREQEKYWRSCGHRVVADRFLRRAANKINEAARLRSEIGRILVSFGH